ncbi:flippase [Flavobacterium lacisediminis]|uniref:Flippase n=1 Tax=Flavobacterium lacisediminis TaxID=2989705 RepID=A0ABT3EE98_9FLAO|nr:flippase [Flavobacterium lacisediminis]MCW1146901.1 flippase [Flavobacterium lacisediminis]
MIQLNSSFKKLISSSGVNFIFRIFGLGTSFLTTVLITRFFGVGTFGDYSLVFALSQIIALLFTLGIPNTLIKVIGNNNFTFLQAKKLLIKGLKGALIFSIIPVLFFYFGSDFLSESVFHNKQLVNYFLIVSISIPLFIVHEIFLYFLIATKNFKKYNLFMFVIPNILLILFLFLFFTLDKNNYFTFIAFSLSIFITVLLEALTIFELKQQEATISISTLKLIKTASPLLFSSLFIYLLNYTNIIMLGIMSNDKQVGIYNIAYKIGSVGFLVIVSVSTIITPKMAELFGKGNLDQLKKLTHNSTRLIAFLSLPIVLVLIFLSDYILSFWGTEAIAGGNTLIIVSIGVFFSAVAGNVDQILNMTENQNILRNITVFSFFVNLFLSYLLIPLYNIEGAAIASLITNILINVLCLYYIKKKLGFYTLF